MAKDVREPNISMYQTFNGSFSFDKVSTLIIFTSYYASM